MSLIVKLFALLVVLNALLAVVLWIIGSRKQRGETQRWDA